MRFEEFYTATAESTFATVLRIARADRHVAHDAIQDAYVQLLRCWPVRQHLSDDVNRRWVIGIAAHKVVDRYRQQSREVEEEAAWPAQEDPALASILDEMSLLAKVRELIDEQPPRRRAVSILYFLEEIEPREIAEMLGIACSTVRTHVERTRAVLKPLTMRIIELDAGGRA